MYHQYDKITDTSSEWKIKNSGVKKWAVTEKIHGANFSFIYDVANNKLNYGKRRGPIQPDENFFNFKSILEETEPKILSIVNKIKNKYTNTIIIIIYGELFGGIYPDIKTGFKPVQKGIYYSPNIHFSAFDIYLVTTANIVDDNEKITGKFKDKEFYLDFEESLAFFKEANIMHAEPLAIYNSYEETLNHNIIFNSLVPAKLGLPQLQENKAEGIVVRSMTNRFLIKRKIPEFSEKKYSDNSLNTKDKRELGKQLITINTLNSAISKIGPLEEYRYLIYEEILKDIFDELNVYDSKEKKSLRLIFMDEIKKTFDEIN